MLRDEIGYNNLILRVFLVPDLSGHNIDGRAFPRILKGIRQKIIQYLTEAGRISDDVGVPDVEFDKKGLMFRHGLCDERRSAGGYALLNVEHPVVQDNLAFLHARHIEDIIDKIQKLRAGIGYLVHVGKHLLPVVNILSDKL